MPAIKKVVWDFNGVSNAEELKRRMAFFMLRRTKEDVHLELPPKTREIINIAVPPKNRSGVSLLLMQSKTAMRRALDLSVEGKMKEITAAILADLEAGNRVVCFTHRQLMAERFCDEAAGAGFEAAFVHGGVTQKNRDSIVRAARSSKGAHLLSATIDSTSSSIDLSYANVANFAELTWEPWKLAQAESRLHRSGQKSPVTIRYFIGRGTADELILQGVISKLDVTAKIIGADANSMQNDLDSGAKGEDALDELYEMMLKRDKELQTPPPKKMGGPKAGSWWLGSKSDPRWNVSGRGLLLFSAGPPPEIKKHIERLKKKLGKPPADLEWGGMKD